MSNTSQEYDKVIAVCRDLFTKKAHDYGTAWRVLRLPSLTDQIFIKAQRIRSLQEKMRCEKLMKMKTRIYRNYQLLCTVYNFILKNPNVT